MIRRSFCRFPSDNVVVPSHVARSSPTKTHVLSPITIRNVESIGISQKIHLGSGYSIGGVGSLTSITPR